jgi:polar amino acid transport system substrate-binding protein
MFSLSPLRTRTALRTFATAAAGGLAVAALAGCSTVPAGGASDAPSGAALDGLVKPGILSVGVTLPDAPYVIPDADNVPTSGITKDLLGAVAKKLGVSIEFVPVAWEGGITGVAAGRYDIYGGSLYDTAERQQAGTFVDFMKEQATLITTKANASKYSDRLDACGASISTIRGTTDVTYAAALTKECEAANKPAMKVTEYPTQQDSDLALKSGRTDVGIQSVPGAAYEIDQGADKAIVGKAFAGGFYVGSLMNSTKPHLTKAVLGAMSDLYESGETKKIFAAYGVTPTKPGINLQGD